LPPDRAGLQREDQERRLERVFRGLLIAYGTAANAQDHRPVPVHDRLEGPRRGVARLRGEAPDQFAIAQAADGPYVVQGVEIAGETRGGCTFHRESPRLGRGGFPY
jgi:hypothetical protein